MEIDESEVRSLSMKAWSLVDKLSDEIEKEEITHGAVCGIAERPWFKEEKQRLIGIKDSVKDVDNMLVSLQRWQSRQRQEWGEAFIKVENSRMHLMANIKHYQEHQGAEVVVDELKAFFSNDKSKMEKQSERRSSNSWVCLFNPWNWRTAAIKIVLICVCVSSTYNKLWRSGQEDECKSVVIPRKFQLSPLDVSYGKG